MLSGRSCASLISLWKQSTENGTLLFFVQGYKYTSVSKWWQGFHYWVNCSFNTAILKINIIGVKYTHIHTALPQYNPLPEGPGHIQTRVAPTVAYCEGVERATPSVFTDAVILSCDRLNQSITAPPWCSSSAFSAHRGHFSQADRWALREPNLINKLISPVPWQSEMKMILRGKSKVIKTTKQEGGWGFRKDGGRENDDERQMERNNLFIISNTITHPHIMNRHKICYTLLLKESLIVHQNSCRCYFWKSIAPISLSVTFYGQEQ